MKKLHRKTGARLGQHLLVSDAIAKEVALASGAKRGVKVFEVGPGKGMLTKELLALGARVIAVEKDPYMVLSLKETFAKEIKSKRFVLIEDDARTVGPDKLFPKGKYVVAANIPYYITGELIRIFLTAKNPPATISILVQKEVAERIARSKKESILSLSVKVFGNPRLVRVVKAGSFNPPPSVDSAILSVTDVSKKSLKGVSEKRFFEVLHAGFGQKRKALLGNLGRAFGKSDARAVWEKLNLDKNVRAEDLPLPVWLQISKNI